MSRPQTVFRLRKDQENHFTMIDQRLIENPLLSWRAKGLLMYLLSRPDDWVIRLTDLVRRAREGEYAVHSALRELRAAGYLHLRTHREGGRIRARVYEIYEGPRDPDPGLDPAAEKAEAELLHEEKPDVENLDRGILDQENLTLNYTELNNTESTHIDSGAERRSPQPLLPRAAEERAYTLHAADFWELVLFRAVTGRWPNRANWEDVIAAVTRVTRRLGRSPVRDDLQPFYQDWTARGYNAQSIKWLTEWAVRGSLPEPGPQARGRTADSARVIEEYARRRGVDV